MKLKVLWLRPGTFCRPWDHREGEPILTAEGELAKLKSPWHSFASANPFTRSASQQIRLEGKASAGWRSDRTGFERLGTNRKHSACARNLEPNEQDSACKKRADVTIHYDEM